MKPFSTFNKTLSLSILLTLSILVYSCKKAGLGGKSTIEGTAYHHAKPIPFTTVYIKYGATSFPGTDVSNYDNHVTADTNAHFAFTGLQAGNYYLYGVGYDYAIFGQVTGGIGVSVKKSKTLTTNLPVTE